MIHQLIASRQHLNKIPGILRVAVGVGVGAGVGAGAARARVCKRRQVTQIGSSQASQQAYRGRGGLALSAGLC